MPSPRRVHSRPATMAVHAAVVFSVVMAGLLGNPQAAKAQIASVTNSDGRRMFVNAEPVVTVKLMPAQPRTAIYLPGEISFLGENRPALNVDRDGVEKLVREAAERHSVDPALIRAVIE